MNWNNRIFSRRGKKGEVYYDLRETYYNSQGEICGYSERAIEVGNSVEELIQLLKTQLNDAEHFRDQVIDTSKIKLAKWD